MEENSIIKYETELIKQVGDAISITNKLLAIYDLPNEKNLKNKGKEITKDEFIKRLNALPPEERKKIRIRLAVEKKLKELIEKHRYKLPTNPEQDGI